MYRRRFLATLGLGSLAGCLRFTQASPTGSTPTTGASATTTESTTGTTGTESTTTSFRAERRWSREEVRAFGGGGDAVYSYGRLETENGTTYKLAAFDAATGDERWRAATGSDWGVERVVAGPGTVYAVEDGGGVAAFAPADGARRWRFSTVFGDAKRTQFAATGDWAAWGGTGPPATDGDASSKPALVYGLDPASGREAWRVSLPDDVFGGFTFADGLVFVATWNELVVYDPRADAVVFRSGPGSGGSAHPPAVSGSALVAVQKPKPNGVRAYDWRSGDRLWTRATDAEGLPPLAYDGVVTLPRGETVHGVDPATGAEQWTVPLPGDVVTQAARGRRLFVATDADAVTVVDRARGRPLGDLSLDGEPTQLAALPGYLVAATDDGRLVCHRLPATA